MAVKKRETVKLVVPLDASGIEDFKPEIPVKVLVVDGAGRPAADGQQVKLDAKGRGSATFAVPNATGLRVLLGPPDATDEELVGLQTVTVEVAGRTLRAGAELKLPAIRIPPFYWWWWLRWCRRFVVHGRVVCPDGSPVPGATVCASDADAWWWWWSKQQIGCVTTDVNGAFTLTFRWCCGWWPWWWWRNRHWHLEPSLADRILEGLRRQRPFQRLPIPEPTPDLAIFDTLLASGSGGPPAGLERALGGHLGAAAIGASSVPSVLDRLGDRLRTVLPPLPGLEGLKLWPWWPWAPWWDCAPDLVFTVTQPCQGGVVTIVNEGYSDIRWNVPQVSNVTLVANDQACCRGGTGCTEDDCLVVTDVCSDDVANVGGNSGAPAAPKGFANPGVIATTGDRPYGGQVNIRGTVQCMTGVDYYEIEYRLDSSAVWNPVPPVGLGGFARHYFDFISFTSGYPGFTPVPFGGRNVYETIEHYEAANPAAWGIDRVWLSDNYDLIVPWLTKGTVSDDTYHLRVVGWNEVAGNLVNPRILDVCGPSNAANDVVVTIDNQATFPPAAAPPDNPCDNIIHLCTNEPNTDVLAVNIIRGDGTVVDVGACGNVEVGLLATLRVDFIAHDPDGHLAAYQLLATYGENQSVDLLALGGTLQPLGGAPVPPAVQVGPTYGHARSAAAPPLGGAVAPIWAGGALRLEVPARLAFPVTCCYQLELRAWKRTIVDCNYNFVHRNLSQYSFMISV